MKASVAHTPVCTYCRTTLAPTPFYVCIPDDSDLPVGSGYRICTPACPDRPDSAVVVERGRVA